MKRHELPPEGYMEDFLREYHHRRMDESVRGHQGGSVWEKFRGWFGENGVAKWVYGAGLAYAAIVAMVLIIPRNASVDSISPEAISNPVVAPIQTGEPSQLQELDFKATTEGEPGEQEF